MNTKLLRQVAALFKEEPRRLDMTHWVETFPRRWNGTKHVPPCGTTGCIAGWAVIHANAKPEQSPRKTINDLNLKEGDVFFRATGGVREEAVKLLSLTHSQAERLFFNHNWPTRFRATFRRAQDSQDHQQAAAVTVRRINHFIKTKGR